MMKTMATSMVLWLLSSTAGAHPGHGHTPPAGIAHHLTEPVHAGEALVALATLALAAVVLGLLRMRTTRPRR